MGKEVMELNSETSNTINFFGYSTVTYLLDFACEEASDSFTCDQVQKMMEESSSTNCFNNICTIVGKSGIFKCTDNRCMRQ